MFKESLRMSISNIVGNKMRTFLTTLGIIIGVMAIIVLITVMESATEEVTSQFESLGTGKLIVQAMGTPLKTGLSEQDLAEIEAVDGVSGLSPTLSYTMDVVANQDKLEDVSIKGYSEDYFRRETELLARGRPLVPSDVEDNARVCLIDNALATSLFSGIDPIGQTVRVMGTGYTVVGILADVESNDVMSMTQTETTNGEMIIPYTTFMRQFSLSGITALEVYLDDASSGVDVADSLAVPLDRAFNYKDDSYAIINMESLLTVMDTMMSLMTNLLVGIASIALLVGGIGIMNMMLVSVTERTNEIGLRKALGARPRSIQMQFLLESVILSLAGGFVGMVLGVSVSMILSSLIDIPTVISTGAISLGVGFSLVVGVIFGWAPARKASNLNPIDALRSM